MIYPMELNNHLTPWNTVLLEKLTLTQVEVLNFMKPEGSLQGLKQPTYCSYLEPNKCTLGPVITFKILYNIIHPALCA